MGMSMFSAQASPIAMDFGTSSVKLLQTGVGDRPALIAAAELAIPDHARQSQDQLFAFYQQELPKLLRLARFKGKRVVCSVPCGQNLIVHMQLGKTDGVTRDDLVKAQLQTQFGLMPDGVVVRAVDVVETHRDGQLRTETICFAIPRDSVMRHVEMLNKLRLDVTGVHTEVLAMMRAFDHLHRREGDENITTLYVDIGHGGTKVAIGHGRKVVFSKLIQIGGRHFDQLVAESLGCDLASARAHRLSHIEGHAHAAAPARAGEHPAAAGARRAVANASSSAPAPAATATEDRRVGLEPQALKRPGGPDDSTSAPGGADLTSLLDSIRDELAMCLRYHQSLFPGRQVDRAVFLGGESRQVSLCRSLARGLRLPARLGDPLARLIVAGQPPTPGLSLGQAQPGWAVACGLCITPNES